MLELDPRRVVALHEAATWSLVIGGAAAATLLLLTAVLVRWSLRREDAVRAVEQARHLASLGQMSAVLAHEIRNPLASLKGNAQLLARSLPDGERPRAKADRVVDEAIRLEHLTNDLLDFARSGEIRIADADPAQLLRAAAGEAAPGPDDARITIDDAGAPRSWPLDAERIRQVLRNLLDNAVEMSEGPVEARVARDGGHLVFTVRDHGPGLGDADLDRVFEPFFTRRTRGTGLGLAVCKRLVELHGGTIAAANAPGGGARFELRLPRGAG
ncbi:MAG: HAMP domain-containing histidine kinase [Kofleriaceae bacterium]|nr:HAMP domain-containing histidine kinase [Kofleriaceae bacterium]